MISLDVYFNAKDGNDAELERVIVDVWMEAMKQQPGFISASLMTPLPQEALDAMGAIKPPFSHEVLSFWESEEQRQAAGAGPEVIRLSIGLETVEDLIADLEQALAAAL